MTTQVAEPDLDPAVAFTEGWQAAETGRPVWPDLYEPFERDYLDGAAAYADHNAPVEVL